jgi:hypothetical protein
MNLIKGRRARVLSAIEFALIFACVAPSWGDSTAANISEHPWEKFSVSAGMFFSDADASVRVGSGLGLDLDLEKALGMEAKTSVFRTAATWRFSENRKHRLDAAWFALHRQATRQVGRDFDIENSDGSITTVQAGTEVSSHFNLDIIETAYSYSFFQDDRADLAAIFGLYVMPINFGLNAEGAANVDANIKFAAPLPVVGFRMDFAITPQWLIRTGSQLFYVEYQGFTGKLVQTRGALEFLPTKHFGFGAGVDSMRISLDGSGQDYPNIDLSGSVKLQYTGFQLYGKYFF